MGVSRRLTLDALFWTSLLISVNMFPHLGEVPVFFLRRFVIGTLFQMHLAVLLLASAAIAQNSIDKPYQYQTWQNYPIGDNFYNQQPQGIAPQQSQGLSRAVRTREWILKY